VGRDFSRLVIEIPVLSPPSNEPVPLLMEEKAIAKAPQIEKLHIKYH
jgi:hypothetical protein